jgi:predicted nucleic acid-binding protein
VYFLDTSAVVKLYHQELGSEVVEEWARDLSLELWISELTRAEFHSVFVRKVREGELSEEALLQVLESFREDCRQRFQIVSSPDELVDRVITLLLNQGKQFPLRTLDAWQIVTAQAVPHSEITFTSADRKQLTVASTLFSRMINPELAIAKQSLGK